MSSQATLSSPLTLDPLTVQSPPIGSNLSSPNSSRPPKKSSFTAQPPGSLVSPPSRKSSNVSPNDDQANLNALEIEAIAAVHELRALVKDLYVSDKLPRTPDLIYLNLTTLEGQPFCVELTSLKGWRVTSIRHDCMNGDVAHLDLHIQYFDSLHSLMDHVSVGYGEKMKDIIASTAPPPPTTTGNQELENESPIDQAVNAQDHTFT